MILKLKIWWHKNRLKWKYKRYLATRNTYNCGDTLFFASRPDMEQVWKQLMTYRKYVIDLMKKAGENIPSNGKEENNPVEDQREEAPVAE